MGWDRQYRGIEYFKKCLINSSFESYAYPSPNKAILNSNFDVSDKSNINSINKTNLEKSCYKIKNTN